MYDVTQFSAIITPQPVTILATGRAAPRVVVESGAMVMRSVMTATLSADHRVVDGAGAARFLGTFKEALSRIAC
jgi:pyruvate dehydrogenase E2 component (dihydrolipoamide acetyltransferase)